MSKRQNMLFSLLLTLFFGAAAGFCLSWSADSRLFPLLLSSCGLGLSFFVFAGECQKTHAAEEGREHTGSLGRKEMLIILWVAVFLVFLFFFGFYPAIIIHTPIFLVWFGAESRKTAVLVTASLCMATYLVFNRLLEIPLYPGLFGLI